MYIYILLKIKWTFWALPDSIKLRENQAENLSWNLVPRPISILCSPDIVIMFIILVPVITNPCYEYTSCVEDGGGWCTLEPINSLGSVCVCAQPMRDDCRRSLAECMHRMLPEFPRPQLVVHAVYHLERCSRCGQLHVKYSGEVDVSDKIFLFKLFFLGFFSVCLPNIYFNIIEYLSTLDLLSFNKSDL